MTLTANTATGTNYIQFNNNAGTAQGYIGFGSMEIRFIYSSAIFFVKSSISKWRLYKNVNR